MRRWRSTKILVQLLVCTVCLLGCTRTRIIDKISIVHVFGFDHAENGGLIGTALYPEYTKSKSSDQIQALEDIAASGVLFVPKMSEHTSTPIELAKIRVLVFGKDYAEAGIKDMVDRLILTPQLGTNIHIAVSAQSARETLNTFKKEKSLTLYERIQHNIEGQNLPYTNLHVFLNHFYGEGMDAYVPMLTINENNIVKVDGLGIFKNEKLKLHLNEKETILVSVLTDYKTQATYTIDLDKEGRTELLAVKGFRSKSKWDWDEKQEKLNLHLHLEWTLTQYPDRFSVEKSEDIVEMKKIIAEKLEKDIEALLTTLKENEVDPLGIGNIVRSKNRVWEEEAFYKKYPSLPINVKVDLQIIHTGLKS
jgi:spore germination protein